MRKWLLPAIILLIFDNTYAQQGSLTVEKIMRDPKWIGTSPAHIFWGTDSKTLYFNWNPVSAQDDSLYAAAADSARPYKTAPQERALIQARANGSYNRDKTALVYSYNGDIYMMNISSGTVKRITSTTAYESNPQFCFGEKQVVYQQEQNLYAWDIAGGTTRQLTSFQRGSAPSGEPAALNKQEQWLQTEQLQLMQVLREAKARRDSAKAFNEAHRSQQLRVLYTGDKNHDNIIISPDGRFITYRLYTGPTGVRSTRVPSFVTESGFTEELATRTKVGAAQGSFESFVYDRQQDTVLPIATDKIPGITDQPDYLEGYKRADSNGTRKPRPVVIHGPYWSDAGTHAIVDIRSEDNKDRWLMLLDAATGKLKLLNRQRDEAWIAGPGIGWNSRTRLGWIDENTCWYQSEASGYSHIYTTHVNTGQTKAITSGRYEVLDAELSQDKKYFYLVTNETAPGEKQLYRIHADGSNKVRLTRQAGAHEMFLSPDEKWIAYRYSYTNQPWELYIMPNKPGAQPVQVTHKAQSGEFRSYPWRDPEVITFKARDGAPVHARIYIPEPAKKNGAAVIFVHGAGYLQNAHKWWSLYFREYMFHNLLADKGYIVMDIDYRGSAGYGRDWRTGIYRHMGGRDLDDQVDGAQYLTAHYGIDGNRIGIYGGSYGGFITLMAMFTKPGTFAAGAALRSVTDWAHYNHGYTSNILNEPFTDSIAYRRSSPIYFAEGLRGHLLMCHGMVDVNVHFQDIIRLSQRLIELGKRNWELAVYPVEDHGFTQPSSWTDEYNRILTLFDTILLKN
ncbi:S9 family peptidase [Chitinophaga japonensis]|uniref:Dipeptidyl aminopeptidase/acylaminoacyl peptidase n=1 Tax=Chitinophaga japonensis TaxID=104662 RepID=A0A562T5G0_CHIJA|nr:prolyl oligopeptidase family serine peptidase [Chitinophaga japonensis]TWI88508.1 dipeptidyl aminopeptidase/acylaminoacyl peptidase [Chitinophaga japonensis]